MSIHKHNNLARISSLKELRPAPPQKQPDYPAILSTKHITILSQKSPSDSRNLPKVLLDLSTDQRDKKPKPVRPAKAQRRAVGTTLDTSSRLLPDSPSARAQQTAVSLRELDNSR